MKTKQIANVKSASAVRGANASCRELLPAFFCFVLFPFALLFFCSASSPFYPINPWGDPNAFLTVGKAMAHHMILYKDIFEQKGPLLYLIHAAAYLISNTSFTGVYLIESLCAAAVLIFLYRLARLYLNRNLSCIAAAGTLSCIVCSFCFYYGDSAEEICLPMLTVGLYYMVRYLKNDCAEPLSARQLLAVGFFTGCTIMIKFTLSGFWFGWMAMACIYTLIAEKRIQPVLKHVGFFLLGLVAAELPWILYFAYRHALKDFIEVYFIINAKAYANDNGFVVKLLDMICFFRLRLGKFPAAVLRSVTGILLPLVSRRFFGRRLLYRLGVPFLFGCTFFVIYYGGRNYSYYYLPLMLGRCFLLTFVLKLLERTDQPAKAEKHEALRRAGAVLAVCLIGVCTVLYSPVLKTTERKRENTVQGRISDYVQAHNPEGTILCYNDLDGGIYLFDNYTRLFKHFERQNIAYERYKENIDAQNGYIRDHEAYWVVAIARKDDLNALYSQNSALKTDYRLCMQDGLPILFQDNYKYMRTYYYYLFELK